jgi:predicted NUDIX family NTP pyrophosphohydrolase
MSPVQQISAGLLMYRFHKGRLEVFLSHPGGPFFVNKDAGTWGVPKGLIDVQEEPLKAAIREFQEETGIIPTGAFIPLGDVTQKSGKIVFAWAFEDASAKEHIVKSNTFSLEWPPHSGKKESFPEVDRAEFFSIEEAKIKMVEAQQTFLIRLEKYLSKNLT